MDFTKEKCAVCSGVFGEDDDVVVCPVCGTPYHRECYFKVGHCINEELHEKGFEYTNSQNEEACENSDELPDGIFGNGQPNGMFGNGQPEKEYIDKEEFSREALEEAFLKSKIPGEDEKVKIDGDPVSYYKTAIDKRIHYYIPRFIFMQRDSQKKLFPNFTAFFFPLTWSVYRKLYKISAVIFAFYIAIFSVTTLPLLTNEELYSSYAALFEAEGVDGVENVILYMYNASDYLTKEEADFANQVEESLPSSAVTTVVTVSKIAVRFIFGLFASRMYFEKTKKLVKKGVELHDNDKLRVKTFLEIHGGTAPVVMSVLAFIAEACFLRL